MVLRKASSGKSALGVRDLKESALDESILDESAHEESTGLASIKELAACPS